MQLPVNSSEVLNFAFKALEGKNSEYVKKLLNFVLPQVIPFNRPMGLKILRITPAHSEVMIPFRRANKNHLGGLHACALATVGEYTAGLLILRRMDPKKQRLVLKDLHAEYSKQGRGDSVAKAEWPKEAPQSVDALRNSDEAHLLTLVTVISDKSGVELAKITTLWQVKPWSQVRLK